MAPPNIPADFDFLDPDVNLAGLPVAELAELRKAEPIHWVDVPGGTRRLRGQGLLARHQARRRQGGVAAQRRLLQLAERGHPDLAEGDDARARSSCSAASCSTWTRRTTPGCARSSRAGSRRAPSDGWRRSSRSARRTSPRPRPPRAAATSSSRCRASCRCRPSPACSACRRTTATSCSAGPTR